MKNITFEEKISLLDKIVKELENGELPIEAIFDKYKQGVELCDDLNKFIKDLEGKVENIEVAFRED